MYFNTNYNAYFTSPLLTGLVVGSTPAIARGFLGKIVPMDKRAELFGFNSFCQPYSHFDGTRHLWGCCIFLEYEDSSFDCNSFLCSRSDYASVPWYKFQRDGKERVA